MEAFTRRLCSSLLRQRRLPIFNSAGTASTAGISRRNNSSDSSKFESVWEPSYLDSHGVTVPNYELVNVQIKGYDFPVLESYGKFIHNSAHRFGIDVEDSWATPCKKLRVTSLKPESSVLDSEYLLNIYERNVQLADVLSTSLPMFVNFIEAAIPAGVTMDVHLHEPEHSEVRHIPDYELDELKAELESMRSSKEKK